MKQIIFINVFFVYAMWVGISQTNSSEKRPPVNPSSAPYFESLNMEPVDSGNLRILYALNAADINQPDTYDDLQCLEIGAHSSKYYSFFVYQSDSVASDWIKKHPNAKDGEIPSGRWAPKGKFKGWSEYRYSEYFKDFSKKELTEYCRMPGRLTDSTSRYSETLPLQHWEIGADTLTVAGYLCRQATCRFRGRDYTVWFTVDIPVNNGPWKFGGLPGLILKAYDRDKQYVFECVRIENRKQQYPIQMHQAFKQYKKTDRQKLWKTKKNIQENYLEMLRNGVSGISAGYMGSRAPTKTYPYNPLELE
jgi:GLPGLI family protein